MRVIQPREDAYLNNEAGHEAQFVIISVVRTERHGFLNFQNRNNVMLTRCKSGMVIVAKKSFLKDRASETLLGKLVVYWDKKASWIGWRDVAAGHVELPGFTRVKTVCTPIQTTRISQTVKQKQVRTSQSITRQSSPLIVSQWPALVRDDMKGTIGAGVQVSTDQVQKTSLPPNVNKLRVNPHPTVIRTGRGPWASTGKLKLVENNEGNLVDSYDSLRWPSLKQSNTEGSASVGVSSGQVQTTSLPPNVNVVTPSPYPTVRRTGWGPWTSPGGLGLPGNNGEDLDAFIGSLKQKKRRK